MFTPVMNAASSLARYVHAFATSLGVEPRPRGTTDRNALRFSSVSGFPKNRCVLVWGISTQFGQVWEVTGDC
jgi:hypothetical protein